MSDTKQEEKKADEPKDSIIKLSEREMSAIKSLSDKVKSAESTLNIYIQGISDARGIVGKFNVGSDGVLKPMVDKK